MENKILDEVNKILCDLEDVIGYVDDSKKHFQAHLEARNKLLVLIEQNGQKDIK